MRVLLDTLREGHVRDPEKVREYLELISTENQRLSSLIDSFLTFSRMERQKYTFELTPVSLPEAIEDALASVGERLRAPGCRFEREIALDLPQVQGDRDALVTVLLNLLDNALKYSGAEKHIVLRAYAQGQDVCLEVEDDGVGFPRGQARKIFDSFHQIDNELARAKGGVGLGLSIVKYILSAHRGTIDATSQPGRGSRFTVRLPALRAKPALDTTLARELNEQRDRIGLEVRVRGLAVLPGP